MNNHLRHALKAACLRFAPRIGLVADHRQLAGIPRRRAASPWHVQEPSSASGWIAAIAPSIRLRPYSAAPSKGGEDPSGYEEEVDRKLREMEKSRVTRTAQRALMDYLHVTRGLSFSDAEHISKRSPIFLSKLLELEEVKNAAKHPGKAGEEVISGWKVRQQWDFRDERVRKALVRFFNFHPVNEFEPFLESIGLTPSECDSLLPRDVMFLVDDEKMLDNYCLLCNYGIARREIGRIYRGATEVFSFGQGILASKLQALEGLGFSKIGVIRLVISTPVVLLRDPNVEFKILQWLDDIGIQPDWIVELLSARKSYNWQKMVEVPQFFSDLGFSKEDIGKLVRKNPDLLLDSEMLFTLVAIMLKVGSGKRELLDLFRDFPNVSVETFVKNPMRGILLFVDIEMSDDDIKKLVLSHGSVLGSAPIKRANSIIVQLCVARSRLREMIIEEPHRLMSYAIGLKLKRIGIRKVSEAVSFEEKIKFLKGLGFVEGSEGMKKALNTFRGKGAELQDRYNFLVETGFDRKDVFQMVKGSPQILNQKIDVLGHKISFLVNHTGYPLSALVVYPAYLCFTVERVKLRMLMYSWLLERGLAKPQLALSTILASSDKYFIKAYVEKDPMGPNVWEKFKREVASSLQRKLCT